MENSTKNPKLGWLTSMADSIFLIKKACIVLHTANVWKIKNLIAQLLAVKESRLNRPLWQSPRVV